MEDLIREVTLEKRCDDLFVAEMLPLWEHVIWHLNFPLFVNQAGALAASGVAARKLGRGGMKMIGLTLEECDAW